MATLGLLVFALAVSVHILLGRIASERLAKMASEADRRKAIARMWSR